MKKEIMPLEIQETTARKLREYAGQLGRPGDEILLGMLAYFKENECSPFDRNALTLSDVRKKINIGIRTIAAILRNMEKTQTKPTLAMLQLLFEESAVRKKELLVEKRTRHNAKAADQEQDIVREQLVETTRNLHEILDRVVVTHNSFGQRRLRLQISLEELEAIRASLRKTGQDVS